MLGKTISVMGLLILMILSGCGYGLHRHGELPFSEIAIGRIENRTLEPKLQDKLHRALTEEFAKHGVSVTPRAERTLSGTIFRYELNTLSERDEFTAEYRVIVSADFQFRDADGKTRTLKKIGSPFIVSFRGGGEFGELLGARDVAEERAMRDVAMHLVGSLIYE